MTDYKKIGFAFLFISIVGVILYLIIGKNKDKSVIQKITKQTKTKRIKNDFEPSNVYKQPIPYEVNLNLFPRGFKVKGDFDGNGIVENLGYNLVDSTKNLDDNFLVDLFLKDSLQKWVWDNRPQILLESDDKNLRNQIFENNGWLMGIYTIINEGNLNNKPGDEISIVFANADYSSTNIYHVYSYFENQWNEISNFSIREWQLPPNSEIDLLKKHSKDSILIRTFNWEAEIIDTVVELGFKYYTKK